MGRKTCVMLHLQPLHEARSRGNPGTGKMRKAKECLLYKPEHLTLISSAHIKKSNMNAHAWDLGDTEVDNGVKGSMAPVHPKRQLQVH